ncbi:hypothetical protein A2115_00130 [Candidatus Woesebacteria bacterium GWA1_41_8]|jgi:hypothetical protein|uniref:Uncharacterized protein n=1 Tax=Candidatus Woesebacteria bacterium GWA1_41_8 TaxID=1802471 RepID=A0A1F7WJ61_9BACT|nr:MAG: hypothetical protein A2115_00130 [Candidatus Woesebacteria bacterium GWA1_41_8]
MKNYSKKKDGTNAAGPKYRTPDHFRAENFGGGSKFSGGKAANFSKPGLKFNPAQFKTQHKG